MVDFELRILPDLEVMMKEFWLKKRFSALTASVVMVAAVAISFLGWFLPRPEAAPVSGTPVTTRQLYQAAVEDAVEADSGEVMPLVCVTPDDDMVTWNDAGDKVLMLSWHRYPESYPNGESITLQYGEVWTFTDKEIKAWYQKNKDGVKDWNLRLKQLIGLPEEKEYTHFTAFWVSPEDLLRPAYQTDITKDEMEVSWPENGDVDFKEWFDGNIVWSYFDSAYPWTRLGYTYDWADNGTDYGLTEFIIQNGAPVDIEFTYTNEEFLNWLAA